MDIKVKVLINGKNHNLQFHHLKIHQKVFEHTNIIVELGYDSFKSSEVINLAHKSWLGQTIEVEIFDVLNTQIKKKYKGIITNIATSLNSVIITANSKNYLLNFGKKYKSWIAFEGIGIVKEIFEKAGVDNVKYNSSKSIKYDFFQQYDETDYDCLLRLARIDGCVFFDNGEDCIYLDKMLGNNKINLGLNEISNVSLNTDINKTKWIGAPYNYLKHSEPSDSKLYSSKISLPKHELSENTYNISNKVFSKQIDNIYNQTVVVKNTFETFLKNLQEQETGEILTIFADVNNPLVCIGTTISCQEHPLLTEWIVVTEAFITFADSIYNANIKGVAVDSNLKPPIDDSKLHKFLIEPAIVIDNLDKENLGRVQIKYLWDTDGRAHTWARIVQFGAGMTKNGISYGTHFTPRVGDHVLIVGENGDPSKPIIIGSLYHSEKKPNFISKNGTEEILLIKTPQETEIRINDKPGSEEILIQTKKSKNIIKILHKEPKIFIESVGGFIEVHSKNIKISADEQLDITAKDINIKATQNIKTESGQNIKTKSGMDSTYESGKNFIIKSTANTEITAGTNLTAKATAVAEISATSQVKIAGTMVESKASATNILQGSLVQIN